MSLQRRFSRIIRRGFRSVFKDVKRFSWATSKAFASLATLKEKAVAKGDLAVRKRLTASNYLNPVFWVMQTFGFFSRYLASRMPVAGLQGLLALACMVAPLLGGVWLTPSAEQRKAYARSRTNYHSEREEYEQADFFARQLCFLSPNDPAALFARAVLLDKMDRADDGRQIAVRLATEEKFLPAVEWLCGKNFEAIQKSTTPNDQRDAELVAGLTWILKQQPDHLKANQMLGTFHLIRGQFSSALPPLRRVTELSRTRIPEAFYSLAVAQKNLGQKAECTSSASIASDGFLERHSRQVYSVQSAIQVLRAMVLAERELEAVSMIMQTLAQRTEQEAAELNWLMGEVCAQWCHRLRTKEYRTTDDLALAIEAIYRGLAAAPKNPLVTEELIKLSCGRDIDDESLEGQLEVALNSGISPGLVHFIMGTRLLIAENSDPTAALQHFELAQQHNETLPGLLNNIADAMVESDSPDLDKALKLVDQAIQIMPDQAYFYDTRGKIRLKRGEPLKAIADLENALAAPELRARVHTKLAEAYLAVNNEEQRQFHIDMAAKNAGEQKVNVSGTLTQPED